MRREQARGGTPFGGRGEPNWIPAPEGNGRGAAWAGWARKPVARGLLIALCFALVCLNTWLDHVTGAELAFTIFYVIPIALAAWSLGRRLAVGLALLSGGAWLADDLAVTSHWFQFTHYWNAGVTLSFFLIIALALSLIREDREMLAQMALTDPLTGIANGRAFLQRAELAVLRAARSGRPLSVVYLDLDNFKAVNDAEGHAAGDDLLRRVAAALRAAGREVDLPARVGGDEFAVLLEETDGEGAAFFARKAEEALRREMAPAFPQVTASIGVATFTRPPHDREEMLRWADAAMYEVKNGAKDGIRHVTVTAEEGPGGGGR